MGGEPELEIDVQRLDALRRAGEPHLLLDIREPWELGVARLDGSLDIPMGELPERLDALPADRPVVVMCRTGKRSARVVEWLRGQGRNNAVNLAGGIDAWALEIDPAMGRY